jgi:hypothetical protein
VLGHRQVVNFTVPIDVQPYTFMYRFVKTSLPSSPFPDGRQRSRGPASSSQVLPLIPLDQPQISH